MESNLYRLENGFILHILIDVAIYKMLQKVHFKIPFFCEIVLKSEK